MKLLTNGEIHAILTKYAYDHRYGKRFPFKRIAELCDMSDETLDRILTRGLVSEKYRLRLSTVLSAIERGDIKFETSWTHDPVLVAPPDGAPQDRIIAADAWRDTLCRSCANRRWVQAWRGEMEMRVCIACIPPEQWPFLHLDKKKKRAYKQKPLTEASANFAHHPRVSLPGLRPSVRVDGGSRRRGVPRLHRKRTGA